MTEQPGVSAELRDALKAYVQTATSALLDDKVGVDVATGKRG